MKKTTKKWAVQKGTKTLKTFKTKKEAQKYKKKIMKK
jgi:hypothetical protein